MLTPHAYTHLHLPAPVDLASRPCLARASVGAIPLLPSRKLAVRWHHTDDSLRATHANLQLPLRPRLTDPKSRTVEWLSTFLAEAEAAPKP